MVLRQERKGIDKKFFELCQNVVSEQGLSLYDMDYLPGSQELRIYIYNPETQTAVIEDCVKIDHALTPYFESEEWMPSELSLEVSSPGVYRTLKSIDQFKMAEGERVELALKSKLTEEKVPGAPKELLRDKKILVNLKSVDENKIKVAFEDLEFELEYNEIKKANVDKDL